MISKYCGRWMEVLYYICNGQWDLKCQFFAFWFIYYVTLFIKRNCLFSCLLPINLYLVNEMFEKDWFYCLQMSNNFYKWIYKGRYILLTVYWKTLHQRGLFNEQRIWTEKNPFFIYCKSVCITQCWVDNRKDMVSAQWDER